jgi:hypothetical protein
MAARVCSWTGGRDGLGSGTAIGQLSRNTPRIMLCLCFGSTRGFEDVQSKPHGRCGKLFVLPIDNIE